MGDKKGQIAHDIIKKDLYTKAVAAFEAAKALSTHPKDSEKIEIFKGSLVHAKYITLDDRLPYLAINKTHSKFQSKIGCVFAIMCAVSQAYDQVCRGDMNQTRAVTGYIKWLTNITNTGLDKYDVAGDLAKGYYLRKKSDIPKT